jgi:rhamnosyltransferase
MVQKTAAVVILFQPEQSVKENINSYAKLTEKLYIYDNSEINNSTLFESSFRYKTKTTYIHNSNNEGIAKRLNQACGLAIKDGFDYLLTMDQDSYFDEAIISQYFNCIETIKEKNVSMFGINYQQKAIQENCSYKEVKFLITSGSVINLKLNQTIGGFDENLFIDFVDTEYCFRSIQKGFKIIEFPNMYMHHNLGKSAEKYSLKTLKKTSRSFHSPRRLYYMTRNFFYIDSIYKKDFATELQILRKDLLTRIKNKLLYGSKTFTTLKILYKAIKDFRNNKMGKLPD